MSMLFKTSDYLYLLITNAVMKKDSAFNKYMFMKEHIYSKSKEYSIAKLIITASFNNDEYKMFSYIVDQLYVNHLLTRRKYKELIHIIELKYSIPQKTSTGTVTQ